MSEEAQRPYYRFLGLRVVDGAPAGESRVELASRPELTNSRGDIHGGAIASLLDAAMGVAVRSAGKDGEGATTVSLTVTYAGPGRGTLVARGRTLRLGRTIATVEADVTDANDDLVAHAIATMRIIAPRG
jgi:uncharacterized protein (TIGR00369 family)